MILFNQYESFKVITTQGPLQMKELSDLFFNATFVEGKFENDSLSTVPCPVLHFAVLE